MKTNAKETMTDASTNVLDFGSTLSRLRKNVSPELVRTRETRGDSRGGQRTVEYVEWHTVADILDESAPNWEHTVKEFRRIGDIIAATVAITIDGVTREGIGTGNALTETGIKKAEHDALKRAAVKFGIARELYRREFDVIASEQAIDEASDEAGFPADPVAGSLSNLVTAKQLAMLRAISRKRGLDAESECQRLLNCRLAEMSRRAASALIEHLQNLDETKAAARKLRRAG